MIKNKSVWTPAFSVSAKVAPLMKKLKFTCIELDDPNDLCL